uniref:Uncharacterized protein n=1 Tax=mine drainage metagenome TaxID=410659 RepID=E6QSP4_9ZZZZ
MRHAAGVWRRILHVWPLSPAFRSRQYLIRVGPSRPGPYPLRHNQGCFYYDVASRSPWSGKVNVSAVERLNLVKILTDKGLSLAECSVATLLKLQAF